MPQFTVVRAERLTTIRYAHERVVVAGVEGESRAAYPAAAGQVISIGGTTRDRCLAYSNGVAGLKLVAGAAATTSTSRRSNCHRHCRGGRISVAAALSRPSRRPALTRNAARSVAPRFRLARARWSGLCSAAGSAMGSHLTQEQIDDLRGESRWPPTIVLGLAIAVPLLLPDRFSLAPKWIEPALLALLLVAHIIADPGRIDRQSSATRMIGVGLLAVLVVGATTQAVVLTVELVNGNKALNNPRALLSSGALVWLETIIAFTFAYWEIDAGGPAARAHRTAKYPHLAFPEHMNPALAPPGWRPLFLDYLYLGLTNATAFSPTDVMPLRHWAKMTMGVQALISLIILGLVVARAVNILT